MPTFGIQAEMREQDIKTSDIRKSKKVPGVVYGKTQDIIDLKVGKVELEVLVHQTQKNPVSGEFTHVDFYAITRGEKLTTKIQLSFIGESPAAREGAIIEELLREVEVSCLPRDLVDHFDVDLSLLKEEGNVIRVSDIAIDSEKYELSVNLEDVVASATMPKVVEEEEPVSEEGEEWEEGAGSSDGEWAEGGEEKTAE